ncbi:MAG TPA: peptidase domain-containing ABC transporter [Candidatus Coprenecus pullistercoris]|nr:peptidase domain-containing ABC transporter [Candidatus Coprenecus pullistercoris]
MKREINIRQHDRSDCAAACVASVCAYYGLMLPMIRIREACGTDTGGTTMQGIIDACGKVGLDAVGLKARKKDVNELAGITKPVILHLEKKTGWLHFVVLYGMDGQYARIMDPEDGRMHRINLKDIEEEWSGYIVAVTPSPEFRKGDRRTDIKARFKEILTYYRKELLLVLGGSIAFIAATLSTSVFLQKIIDRTIPSGNRTSLLLTGGVMLLLAVLGWLISYMQSVITIRTSLKIDCRLVTGYYRKLFSLPVSFFDTMSSGELNARISDAYRIRSFITERLMLMAVSVITLAITATVLMTFYWKLTLITLAFIPIFILIYVISDKVNRKLNRSIIEENAKFEQSGIEWLSSARAVRYSDAAKEASRILEGKYLNLAGALYKGGVFSSLTASTSDFAGKLISIVTVIAGAFFVLRSELTVGELVSFFSLASLFSSPIIMLIESNREIAEARISAERIFDILDLESEDAQASLNYTPSAKDPIEVKGLNFSFPGRERLIVNLSFSIQPGRINLIKGCNGSGKSTLAALLMRGYAPEGGSILCGGVDIQAIPLGTWRRFAAIVPQKPEIFDGTILDNIIMGDRDYDLKAVAAACAMAGMNGMQESLPGGLLTPTGERACRLSGGEKQKISIARALYRKPGMLILDEASTHLDASARAKIAGTIRLLRERGVTIVIISHEDDAESIADNIIDISEKNAHSQA